jgi:hypothetical protein
MRKRTITHTLVKYGLNLLVPSPILSQPGAIWQFLTKLPTPEKIGKDRVLRRSVLPRPLTRADNAPAPTHVAAGGAMASDAEAVETKTAA